MTPDERRDFLFPAEHGGEVDRRVFFNMIDDKETGPAFFINTCCWTYDPRPGPNDEPIGDTPFFLWENQEKAVAKVARAIRTGHHLGVEKSRDMGVTWFILAVILWYFLRVPGFSALIGALTQDLLDNEKDTDSLGWKLNYMIDRLPPFLLPKGWNKTIHHSWAQWMNPENGNAISGRAPTARFAVGGRRTVVYFDDFAQWTEGASAWKSAKASTACRLASWTVNPDDPLNHAYQIRFAKGDFVGTHTPIIPVSELHWSGDPRKQLLARDPVTGEMYNVWKRQTLEDIPLEQFERDYEGIYEGAAKGRIYAHQMPFVRVGKYPFDPRFPLYTLWDFGMNDVTVIGFLQWDYDVNRLRFVDVVIRSGQDTAYYVPFVMGKKDANESLPYESSYDDADYAAIAARTAWKKPVRENGEIVYRVQYAGHFGDPAGQARGGSSAKSPITILNEHGIEMSVKNTNDGKGHKGRHNAARFLMRHLDIDEEHCQPIIDALQTYKWNKAGSEPEHDEASHCATMWEYGAVNLLEEFKDKLETIRQAQATGVLERPGGFFYAGTQDGVQAALRDEKEAIDRNYGGGYNRGSGRSITGY